MVDPSPVANNLVTQPNARKAKFTELTELVDVMDSTNCLIHEDKS